MSADALILGVDLSAEPRGTAAVTLRRGSGSVDITAVGGRLSDDALVDAMTAVGTVAVDVPLGWPDPFVRALGAHHDGRTWPVEGSGAAHRRRTSRRETDLRVAEKTGVWPLSVSADRIGAVAMRGARLQAMWSAVTGLPADRTGRGAWLEVYPAAALKIWGLRSRGYKGKDNRPELVELAQQLRARAPWVSLPEGIDESDDVLDACVCALVGLCALVGATEAPPEEARALAGREGWIHLPSIDLDALGQRL